MGKIRRIYVEKKKGFDIEAKNLFSDLKENLGIKELKDVRILNRYDISGISEDEYIVARKTILSEPPVDNVFDENLDINEERAFAIEYLPGQYDQRADSAAQCIQIITLKKKPIISTARVILLKGNISDEKFLKIKKYMINPVDSREASLLKPKTLKMDFKIPMDVEVLKNFILKSRIELDGLRKTLGLAMSSEDVFFCQKYFKEEEKRDPTITEIKMLDTYWSDHCRHTTFNTLINNIEIEDSFFTTPIKKALKKYLKIAEFVYPKRERYISLMKVATLSMKRLKKMGKLNDMEVSGEVNACSIIRNVNVDGRDEEWLIMFKNETHNHPTEIEPFGGAATCLGGAIRDPLSGRAYVYQAMRVTGSGDPRRKIEETLVGKLPQRKITTEAALGYSSYGNQIGLATGLVSEIYDEGYIAKRMEVGAVIGAVPRKNIIREEPKPGDIILLVGGKTGRDGIGGATGSSKEHTEDSIYTAGAEVQKGNPPEERKLQRLFRNPEVCKMIKKSNDFGAGGVSVAIGELASGLKINLDSIPKKYEGLDGTELAISESQERMAVVLDKKNVAKFKKFAYEENLEAIEIARVTGGKKLRMYWRGNPIVNISRDFINTNGVRQEMDLFVSAPVEKNIFFNTVPAYIKNELPDLKRAWLKNLSMINIGSQMGLIERFDSTIGAGTVLSPFGGKFQQTPIESMIAKIPVSSGETDTGTVMSYGFNPEISKWSPFHGAVYAIVEAVAKIVAIGGDNNSIRVSLQEYFEKLGKERKRWGKPFSALLGAFYTLSELEIASIGGKDSMSGSFKDLDVPPTLIAFAVNTVNVSKVISPEFKKAGNSIVVYVKLKRDKYEIPRLDLMKTYYTKISKRVREGKILSSQTIRTGGLAAAISKMVFGNRIGFEFIDRVHIDSLFTPDYGSILLEIDNKKNIQDILKGVSYQIIGKTCKSPVIKINNIKIRIDEAYSMWGKSLEKVFPNRTNNSRIKLSSNLFLHRNKKRPAVKIAKPKVLIPVFPGTNCEYDTEIAFKRAGARVEIIVFRNLKPTDINDSLRILKEEINSSQIIALPGGFSSGDEPDGSGKFIAAVFRNPRIKEAVMDLLKKRDGLMLGICNGFQALIKLGLVPYGEVKNIKKSSPTLTYNTIGRHISRMIRTKVVSVLSPWFILSKPGDIHTIPVSHGEGRFVANQEIIKNLLKGGQVATQYVDLAGNPTYNFPFNPNGSVNSIEGITSPDGRVLGKMAHSERRGNCVAKNVPGEKDQKLFESGVEYFK